jgi:hypothetical protein
MLLCSSRQFAAKRQPVEKPAFAPGGSMLKSASLMYPRQRSLCEVAPPSSKQTPDLVHAALQLHGRHLHFDRQQRWLTK